MIPLQAKEGIIFKNRLFPNKVVHVKKVTGGFEMAFLDIYTHIVALANLVAATFMFERVKPPVRYVSTSDMHR